MKCVADASLREKSMKVRERFLHGVTIANHDEIAKRVFARFDPLVAANSKDRVPFHHPFGTETPATIARIAPRNSSH